MPRFRRPDVAWLVAVILVALNLRAVLTSVPPLAVDLAAQLNLSAAATGALTTVPVACMGLFAPVAAWATRWRRESTVLSFGVVLIAVSGVLRGFGGVVGLFVATALAGVGIAVAGTLLPGLVRTRSPERVGPITGIYTAALIGGSLVASAAAEPVRAWLDTTPQAALAVWGLPAGLALMVWVIVARTLPAGSAPRPRSRGLPWRDGSAWLGTAFMGTQSLLFYGTLAWLAASYIEAGMSTHDAGLLLGLFGATQVITAFAVPALAHRSREPRRWFAASIGTAALGLWLLALAPHAFGAAPWLWAGIVGLGMGGNFGLALTAVTQLAPTPEDAPAYTGLAFLVGYLAAAAAPALLGLLADLSGGYRLPFLTLAVLALGTLAIGVATAARATAAG